MHVKPLSSLAKTKSVPNPIGNVEEICEKERYIIRNYIYKKPFESKPFHESKDWVTEDWMTIHTTERVQKLNEYLRSEEAEGTTINKMFLL